MSRPADHLSAGFTLVEVLVALSILSIALAALFQVFSTSLDASRATDAQAKALSRLESLAATVGTSIPLRAGAIDGAFPDDYHWHLSIVPYGNDDDQKAWPVSAYTVEATILWQQGQGKRSVSTKTLRLAPKELGK